MFTFTFCNCTKVLFFQIENSAALANTEKFLSNLFAIGTYKKAKGDTVSAVFKVTPF